MQKGLRGEAPLVERRRELNFRPPVSLTTSIRHTVFISLPYYIVTRYTIHSLFRGGSTLSETFPISFTPGALTPYSCLTATIFTRYLISSNVLYDA